MASEYQNTCPECQSNLIHDHNKGEYICQNCGYVVVEQAFDYGPESHSFDLEEKSKMCVLVVIQVFPSMISVYEPKLGSGQETIVENQLTTKWQNR